MLDTKTAPYGALLLRLALGIMFVAHGLTKFLVFTLPGTAEFFASVGFPAWLGYVVPFAETGGGAMLILGIAPRLVSGGLSLILFGASTVHFKNGWMFTETDGGWEYPVFLAVAAVALALIGDGAFSLLPSAKVFGKPS